MRGYFGIGIYQNKHIENLGTLWRSASIFGASFIFTIGHRYRKQCSDTLASEKHIPLYNYASFEDFYENMPYNCPLVGIEILESSQMLNDYCHLERSIYLLGPEDGGLPESITSKCHRIVQIPGKVCLNVAVAGSIVMYDRFVKLGKLECKK